MQGDSDDAGGGKRTKWGEIEEKGPTIQHKLVTHGQYFVIPLKLQNYFDVCMGLRMYSKLIKCNYLKFLKPSKGFVIGNESITS